MLLLDSKTRVIDNITVFPDHADPMQFYYLPLAPHLTTRADPAQGGAEIPQFSLIRFRGEAGTGGFLNFDVNIGANEAQLQHIRQTLMQEDRLDDLPRIAPVPLVGGSVRLLMLGRASGDVGTGTRADTCPAFVLQIDHSATPSLYGDNQAAFSIKLDAAGVAVIEKSLDGEILPIAVVYSLDYLGLRPAYSVRLSIDWERTQTHMDESFSAGFLFTSVDIATIVDELVENRTIVLESDTFVTEDDDNEGVIDRRDAALAQVRSMITEAFFQPTLPPIEPGNEDGWEDDLRTVAAAASMAAAGPMGGVAASTYFSYSRTDQTRVDRKVLNVNMSERVTIQRSMHPQGHLAGLFRLLRDSGLSLDRFVKDVNIDDPWFKRRRLAISSRANFDNDLIGSINLRARYGNQIQNVLLTKDKPDGELDWASIIEDDEMRLPVEYNFEVNFHDVDTTERPRAVISEPRICDVENLEVDPRSLYAIMPIPIVPIEFPWEAYPVVEVHVRYRDAASGLDQGEVYRLDSEDNEALWNVFVLDPAKNAFEYRIVYRGANNRDIDSGWKTSEEEQISLRDPFPRKRVVQVVPSMNWTQVDRCFVDLRYTDRANGVSEETSFEFTEGSTPQMWSIPVANPEHRQVLFKTLILFRDGRMIDVPESVTLDRRILVRTDMRGRRIVEVRPPADFRADSLKRVTVDLRFEDFEAGLSFADSFILEDSQARGFFEYDYVSEARDRYEMRATFLFANGLERSTDWQAASGTVQQIEVR